MIKTTEREILYFPTRCLVLRDILHQSTPAINSSAFQLKRENLFKQLEESRFVVELIPEVRFPTGNFCCNHSGFIGELPESFVAQTVDYEIYFFHIRQCKIREVREFYSTQIVEFTVIWGINIPHRKRPPIFYVNNIITRFT